MSLSAGLLSGEPASDAPAVGASRPASPGFTLAETSSTARFPDGPPLRRAPTIEGIEKRAVSAAFLRSFTSSRVTADDALARRCTRDGLAFLKSQIKALEKEHSELRKSMQRSVVVGSMRSSGTTLQPTTSGTDAMLAQIGRRTDQFKFDLQERNSRAYLTTRDVHREIIKAEADAPRCRYIEQPHWIDAKDEAGGPFVGVADFFVSHSWDSPWESVVDAVVEHSDAVPEGVSKPFYWIDIFAVNQHSPNGKHCTCDDNCIGCYDSANTRTHHHSLISRGASDSSRRVWLQ